MLNKVKKVFSRSVDGKTTPVVSLVVVVYDMADQAQKTLISMGTD
ncbi:MAG: DNA-directed RNA polymerase subunit E'/Rpb7, partial [Halioglobus sp.]